MDLFTEPKKNKAGGYEPLPLRMCPKRLSDFVGQKHILGKGKLLTRVIESDAIPSLIFYGPPGCGKSALARIIAEKTKACFVELNAVTAGVAEIAKEVSSALERRQISGQNTVLLIDEIHHFNKNQQDSLLPDVEKGIIGMIGITTENPYYYVNPALISRSLVFEFLPLGEGDIEAIMKRALADSERGLAKYGVEMEEKALKHIAGISNGDARRALNALYLAVTTTPPCGGKVRIDLAAAEESIQKKSVVYDKKGDEHYDTISAFIKSMRGTDPDAALYWLGKMLRAGEDPRFIARRIVICASEDVGNADPMAVVVANAALQVAEFVGMPEARIPLAQATTYVACAPKSNASYLGIGKVMGELEKKEILRVPRHLTKAGSKDYKYPHDYPGGYVEQEYLPEKRRYYVPKDIGYESELRKKLDKYGNEKGNKKKIP